MEAVQTEAHNINGSRAGSAGRCGRRSHNVNRRRPIVVLTQIDHGDATVGLHDSAEIVLRALIVASATGNGPGLDQHGLIHQDHGGAVNSGHNAVQFIQESVLVCIHVGGSGQINRAGELVGSTRQQFCKAVEGIQNITGTAGAGSAVDHAVVEEVRSRLDLLLRLKCQFVNSAACVLQNAVNFERTAHDDGVRGLFHTLRLASGIFAVNRTNSGCAGGLQLDITICQSGTTSTGGNGVVKRHSVQQQRAALEHINDHLVNLIGHSHLCFCKSNRHV